MPQQGDLVIFIVYLILITVVSVPIIKKLFNLYEGIEIYHALPKETGGKGETLPVKIYYVIKYILILQIIGTAFGLTYIPYLSSVTLINLDTALALGLLISMMNIVVRHVSFSEVGKPVDSRLMKRLKSKLYDFSFSFILSLYFLSLFGFGVGLINGQILSGEVVNSAFEIKKGLYYGLAFIIIPIIGCLVNEVLLNVLGVPDELTEEAYTGRHPR